MTQNTLTCARVYAGWFYWLDYRAELLLSKARLVESIHQFEQQQQQQIQQQQQQQQEQQEQSERLEPEKREKSDTKESGGGEFCRNLTAGPFAKKVLWLNQFMSRSDKTLYEGC